MSNPRYKQRDKKPSDTPERNRMTYEEHKRKAKKRGKLGDDNADKTVVNYKY